MNYDASHYIKAAMYIVKQFPDLTLKDFKKMLRKKAGKGLDCNFEQLYKEYLEHRNDLQQTVSVPKENS